MTTVITGKLLIDGTGSEPISNPVIVIEGDKIAEVSARDSVTHTADVKLIDLSDKVLMPGLVDAHIHLEGWKTMDDRLEWLFTPLPLSVLRAANDARRLLEVGFTAVRCVGGPGSIFLKQAINEGAIPGPRIKTSGRSLCQTGGGGDYWDVPIPCMKEAGKIGQGLAETVDGPEEIRKVIRERRREGADLIKFLASGAVFSKENPPDCAGFRFEEIEALVDEAHRLGLSVSCHAHGTQGIKDAVRGGVDTIEHGTYMDDECIELMLQKGTYLIPTFAIMTRILESAGDGIPEYALRQGRQVSKIHRKNVVKAYQAGVRIACGTDFVGPAPVQHGGNAIELLYMLEAGMRPMDVLVSATGGGAKAIGLDQAGTITQGKWADLIALDDNPLEKMETVLDVPFVMKGGVVAKDVYRDQR